MTQTDRIIEKIYAGIFEPYIKMDKSKKVALLKRAHQENSIMAERVLTSLQRRMLLLAFDEHPDFGPHIYGSEVIWDPASARECEYYNWKTEHGFANFDDIGWSNEKIGYRELAAFKEAGYEIDERLEDLILYLT